MNYLKKYKEQITYLIFGVLTTLVNFIIYFSLCAINIPYTISNIIAIFVSILFAYITNKIWVFKSKSANFSEILTEFFKFFSLRFVSSVIDIILLIILIDFINLTDLIAKTLTAVLVIILNYLFSKLIIFKK